MTFNLQLLHDARVTRNNLLASKLPRLAYSSIRDAVELAADAMRQLVHEASENSEAA